jgi:DNA-binding IclR family transcriptional regulator
MIMPRVPGTQAVSRAVSLLKVFTDERPEWRLSDLAQASGLHRATAHRLLAALEREGMVTRDATGDLYRLGPEAIALGARAVRATDLRAASRPMLEALAESTGETVTLEVPLGTDMLILDEVLGQALVGTNASIGTRWPMKKTSTGKAILAARKGTPLGLVGNRHGFFVAKEELERGYTAIGSAIFDAAGTAVAAISVGGPSARFPAARIAKLGPLIRDAAESISSSLGHR